MSFNAFRHPLLLLHYPLMHNRCLLMHPQDYILLLFMRLCVFIAIEGLLVVFFTHIRRPLEPPY